MKRTSRKSASNTPSEKHPTEEKTTAADALSIIGKLDDAERSKVIREMVGDLVPIVFGAQRSVMYTSPADVFAIAEIVAKASRWDMIDNDEARKAMLAAMLDEKQASYQTGEANGRNWMEHRKHEIIRLSTKEGMSAQAIADKLNEDLHRNPALVRARSFIDRDGKNGVDELIDKASLTKDNVLKILKAMNADARKSPPTPKKKHRKEPK